MRRSSPFTTISEAVPPNTAFFGVLLVGTSVMLLIGSMLFPNRSLFYLSFAAVSFYLYVECARFLRRNLPYKLLAPPFLATFLYFFMSHLLGAMGSFGDESIYERFDVYLTNVWSSLADLSLFVAVAAFSMWRGFDWSEGPGTLIGGLLLQKGLIRRNFTPRLSAAIVLQVVAIAVTLWAISVGVFGFASTAERRAEYAGLLQFITYGTAAGSLSLLLMFGALFQRHKQGKQSSGLWVVCLTALALQVVFGAISGFKSQVVVPFIVVGVAYYFVYTRFLWRIIPIAVFALIVSYMLIEPYRAYLYQMQLSGTTGTAAVLDALGNAASELEMVDTDNISLPTQVVMRSDLSGISAVGLAYAEAGFVDDQTSSAILESIVMSPIYAFIPRALWPEKPSFSMGVWFNQTVLDETSDQITSVGMGPIVALYIAGGWLGVVLGFFGIGFLQGLFYHGFLRQGAGGAIVFLTTSLGLATIPADIGPALQGIFQILPIMVMAQFYLLRPTRGAILRVAQPT